MLLLFSILGLCGGLLCCVGDILFDLKGAGNEKLGTSKNIDSNWMKMSEWRFGAYFLLPGMILFLIFWVIHHIAHFCAFAKGLTPIRSGAGSSVPRSYGIDDAAQILAGITAQEHTDRRVDQHRQPLDVHWLVGDHEESDG